MHCERLRMAGKGTEVRRIAPEIFDRRLSEEWWQREFG